jgi:hypothetical protein
MSMSTHPSNFATSGEYILNIHSVVECFRSTLQADLAGLFLLTNKRTSANCEVAA